MDNILPAYNDPLFSILVIVVLILIVAITSLLMGRAKESKKSQTLKKFLGTFKKNHTLLNLEELPFEQALIKPLTLLSEAFCNQGEYQKAINLNLYLIENISNFFEKEKILEQLGHTYLKAGFLKRSESIYLEILDKHPRNTTALYNLGVVYELLHEYDKTLETLEPLKILGEDVRKLEMHINLSKLLENQTISRAEKIETLEKLLTEEHHPYRRIIQALFNLDLEVAWRHIYENRIDQILDILWLLPSSNLNFDIIATSETLRAIYLANGKISDELSEIKSNIFTIDTILSARKGGDYNVDLSFNYGCGKCKQHFPISFTRCPKCYNIDLIQIKETLAKKQSKTSYSLL